MSTSRAFVRCAAALLTLASASSCAGRGAIFLTIDAQGANGTLRIPDDVDRLHVTISNEPSGDVQLDKDYALDPAIHSFPLTLAIEQGAHSAGRIKVDVGAYLGSVTAGTSTSTIQFTAEDVIEVTLRIDAP